MPSAVYYLPVITTVVAAIFFAELARRYQAHPDRLHYLWWAIGVAVYGLGTLTEALTTLLGWHPWIFRAWYISGALLGGAPLAQGTVYLLLPRRRAHILAFLLLCYVAVAATCVLLSPLDLSLAEPRRLSGRVLVWSWVRLLSPVVNTYAVIFLIGGAILSAIRYRRRVETYHRFVGNVFITVGAILPGIGGAATRLGHVEVLYITELIGLLLIWHGYRLNVRAAPAPVHVPA
jgi:hypothetical protein